MAKLWKFVCQTFEIFLLCKMLYPFGQLQNNGRETLIAWTWLAQCFKNKTLSMR